LNYRNLVPSGAEFFFNLTIAPKAQAWTSLSSLLMTILPCEIP
jgi:hypothetical protein